MFILLGSGRYLVGIDSQVFLPIITALALSAGQIFLLWVVTYSKYAISFGNLQGRLPFNDIPPLGVQAAIALTKRIDMLVSKPPLLYNSTHVPCSCTPKSSKHNCYTVDLVS